MTYTTNNNAEALVEYFYIGLDINNRVQGYSSSKNAFEKEVQIDKANIPEDFAFKFSCYEYKPDSKNLVLNQHWLNQEITAPEPLTDVEQIAQKQSQTELELMLLKQQLSTVLGGVR